MVDNQGANPTRSVTVPNYYFNGYQLYLSNADVGCALALNGGIACALSMSYTMAKSLAQELTALVASLEEGTGHELMTLTDVDKAIIRMNEEAAPNG